MEAASFSNLTNTLIQKLLLLFIIIIIFCAMNIIICSSSSGDCLGFSVVAVGRPIRLLHLLSVD
jgi:hypothetical protein